MPALSRSAVRDDLIGMIKEVRQDWDFSSEITEQSGLFRDVGFESIDAVALGSSLEEHYDQSLPFADFLTKASEQKLEDITVAQLLDFLMAHLDAERLSKTS